MVRRCLLAALFLLVLALGAASLSAWEFQGFWWPDRVVVMTTGALGQGQLEGSSYQDLAAVSLSNWYSYCDPEPFVSLTVLPYDCSPNARDGTNCIGWANLGQCESGTKVLGRTYSWSTGEELIEADVLMNSSCSVSGYWTPTRLLSSMTHEMGHVLGLAHSPVTPSLMNQERDRDLIWYPEDDDCAGALWIYGPPKPPTVTTYAASLVTQTSATLNGAVNPNGDRTSGWFNLIGPDWGITGTAFPLGAGRSSVPFTYDTMDFWELSCSTTYRFQVAAENIGGTVFGEWQYFTTSSCDHPTGNSLPATSIGQTSATLNASVNPNGTETSAFFEWGPTTAYIYLSADQAVGSGNDDVALSLSVASLACGSTYHFRVVASNSFGTLSGDDLLLTTEPCTGDPTLIFADGFESGTTDEWSFRAP